MASKSKNKFALCASKSEKNKLIPLFKLNSCSPNHIKSITTIVNIKKTLKFQYKHEIEIKKEVLSILTMSINNPFWSDCI